MVTVIGTRPEAIKMAPVVRELQRRADAFEHKLVTTAQHREMLDQVLRVFNIVPDIDMELMEPNQDLADFAARSLTALARMVQDLRPDAVLVQGDTTTVMMAALAAFYHGVKVGHVEAGLRSFDRRNPFPEEINRRIAGCLSDIHFAPTDQARENLFREGIPPQQVFLTGNTIVDALQSMPLEGEFENRRLAGIDFDRRRVVLVTAHRRENHGEPLRAICKALKRIAASFDDVEVVYPVHLNPNVSDLVKEELSGVPKVHLTEPLSYVDLLKSISRSYLVLTDSGGIQEESPSFRRPVLVLREVTERPELIEAGAGRIVGTNAERIYKECARLLTNSDEYRKMSDVRNPFGDGQAAKRIVRILDQLL
ncbi:MAG TPA: UDP-N-acetylglucosamine 2-epimerase (non-hydrolyzing) [Blastocatellia bacterium]|nr:UDP-N-acetylglucosamine 2-epimerase (non-hydrolyzing) [Blastocatellia bacterium]